MPLDQIIRLSVLVIFAVNAVLVIGLVILKTVHRRRTRTHNARRLEYVGLLSRHLSYENCTDPITERMAEDPAFLDALIDMRNAITGDEVATLRQIVNRHGVIERQVKRLDSSLLLGRRLRAAVALAEIGDETAADALMQHLDNREPEIRIQAARGLGRMQWTPAIDHIVSRFSGEIPWVRSRFSDTLIGYGTKATWPLLAYVRINHRFETKGPSLALRTIGQIQDDEAVGPLIDLLDASGDIEIRVATIEALGEIANPEAEPSLTALLSSPDWQIRAKAASALGGLGDPGAIPGLVESMRDHNWWVRRSAAGALAGLPQGIETLYVELDDKDRFAADAAAEALTDAGELVSARRRIDDGESEVEPLLQHMESGVPS